MIGHYLLTLTKSAEDRVLTSRMRPGANEGDMPGTGDYVRGRGRSFSRCLIGTTQNAFRSGSFEDFRVAALGLTTWQGRCIETQFDLLCWRFGAPRINAAIRNRILSNRARRILGSVGAPLSPHHEDPQ